MFKRERVKHNIFLLSSIIFFGFCLIFLFSNRFECYVVYERLEFNSSGATLYANLFYPTNDLTFQEQHPLIIFTHGLGSQKDLDPRVPNEFTKRGFFVTSLDYRGDGESTGHLLDLNPNEYQNRTNVPSIAQDCSKLLDYIEGLPIYDQINKSQIGLIGHSLGGMVALMNGALDDRFSATVTWAGLVNFSASLLGIQDGAPFMKYIPANIINQTNPRNLMMVHSIYDKTVPYKSNALVAQKLTNCALVNITQPLPTGDHFLLTDQTLISSINWFEAHFFNSDSINGPIRLSYVETYVLLFLTMLALFLTTLSIMSFISKYFIINKEEKPTKSDIPLPKKKDRVKIIKHILKLSAFYGGFLSIWIFFFIFQKFTGLVSASLVIMGAYFAIILTKYIITAEKKKQRIILYIETRLKDEIKSQFHKNVLLYSFISIFVFMVLYFSFSLSYPFAFFSPVNVVAYILTFSIYPLYLSIEIFYRKVIYPALSFVNSVLVKTIITCLLGLFNIALLMFLSFQLFLISAFFASFLVFFAVMTINSLIYEKTNKFSSVLISSFIIIQIFFGSAVSSILGFGSVIAIVI